MEGRARPCGRRQSCAPGRVPCARSPLADGLSLPDLHGLPWFVNVSESRGPGTILWSFSFNCSSHTPTLKLLQVQPPSPFFNAPSLARWQGLYVGQVGSWDPLEPGGRKGRPTPTEPEVVQGGEGKPSPDQVPLTCRS